MTPAQKLQQLRESKNPSLGAARRVEDVMGRFATIKGDKGDPGRTPVKGIDYLTPKEMRELHTMIEAKIQSFGKGLKGDAGPRGEKGSMGIGTKGTDGRDGFTPKRLVDYWTPEDQKQIVEDVLRRIPTPKDGVVDYEIAANTTTEKLSQKKLKIEHIEGLPKTLNELIQHLRLGGFRGGGGSSSSSGTSVVSEVVSGSGTTWTLAHTPNSSGIALYANGQRLTPTIDYTLSGAGITTALSWAAGTIIADYVYT